MKNYLKRYLDDEIEKYLDVIGAILIVGPKWCGKTTTGEHHAKSIIKLQDKDKIKSYLKWADIKPSKLLEGEKPRLIDEWQVVPVLWDAVRNSVDELGGEGLYILTGSTIVEDSEIMHSGTGRIHKLMMRPMSLYESGESNGQISLVDLFYSPNLDIDGITSDLSIEELIFVTCRGGWPESLNKKSKEAQLLLPYVYVDSICENDASLIDGVKRDPNRVKTILASYARNISESTKDSTIISDINANFEDISKTTYYQYIDVLKRLYVIDNVKAWSPNIRSKTSIRTSSKKQFIDPSIAVAALGLTPELLMDDLNTFGFIFENLCIRDLKVYSSAIGGRVSFYRDRSNLEIDCVLHLKDGKYALIEFKLGSMEEEKGAKNLLKLNDSIARKNMKQPSFLAIITGGELAYTRKDGVKVIPIGCLR